MKTRIDYRLLQLLLSPISGDRITLALLHWDGIHLRAAWSPAGLVGLEPEEREGVHVAVADIAHTAEKVGQRLEKEPIRDLDLAHAFPVREGFGAALHWTPVVTLETPDPAIHFSALVQELRLDRGEPSIAECSSVQHDACPPPSDTAPPLCPQAIPPRAASCMSEPVPSSAHTA